ncbi:mitochondrial intermembrane space import and assembly protein 40-like isoform X2 [Salmo trutta]|uniref:mitochondrial intermembrane space import and assembly protein 40-like isoform X2 n=1 Tax=Salmo trutta TaxID=8032 RepID=UPI0011329E77|nr:mitochondrial intermembrane space import and assembly protein 40-like isoform X2 [Salmo trutta]
MSYCKDRIIFVTKEDHEAPSNAELIADDPNDPYEDQGLILPSGEINWNCPCLGGMASGPCGTQFKEAFSCFHNSNEEVKGSECIDNFRAMQECMQKYPELYPQEDENDGVAAGGADATAPAPAEDSAPVDSTAPAPAEDSAPAPVASSDSTLSPPTQKMAMAGTCVDFHQTCTLRLHYAEEKDRTPKRDMEKNNRK